MEFTPIGITAKTGFYQEEMEVRSVSATPPIA